MPHFDKQFDNLFDAKSFFLSMPHELAADVMENHINTLRNPDDCDMSDEEIKKFCTVHVFSDAADFHHLKENNKLKYPDGFYEFTEGAEANGEVLTLGMMIVGQDGAGHIDLVLEADVNMDL